MDEMQKKISEFYEMAEKDPVHRAMLTDSADRLDKIYKARIRSLPRINEEGRKKVAERGGRIVVVKNIELKMCFDDDFVPPEKFDKSLCSGKCPFLAYEPCETSDVYCCVTAVRPSEEECPIKKFFN